MTTTLQAAQAAHAAQAAQTAQAEIAEAAPEVREDPRLETLFNAIKQRIEAWRHVPVATYRVQLNRFFTFQDARKQIDYFDRLGISDLYASPYFTARPESLHGYDIVNHNELNPNIGTREDYDALVAELKRRGMFQVLDVVPNHMGIGQLGNAWWIDVLENGPASIYSSYFDIDWDPINTRLTSKVLLPILGDQYGRVLENGELQLSFAPEQGRFWLNYYDQLFPIAPRTYREILELELPALLDELGPESECAAEYQSIITAISNLPSRDELEPEKLRERNREKEVIKRRLAAVCADEPRVLAHIRRNIQHLNGSAGDPRSFDMLDQLLDRQAYRLSFWRVAAEEINYRRFFDINELAAIQVDQPEVFRETHRLVLEFLSENKLSGLRIDHVDGLRDPAGYFQDLQRGYFLAVAYSCMNDLPEPLADDDRLALQAALLDRFEAERAADPDSLLSRPLYVVVEKILGRGEKLPSDWVVAGTTGYEFTNAVNGLLVDSANHKAFDALYASFIGEKVRFSELVYQSKRQIMLLALSSEVNLLTNMLNDISQADRRFRDFTLYSLRQAIREVIACFPVYRTYITARQPAPDERDRRFIETAVLRAKQRNPAVDPSIFDFIREVLLLAGFEDLGDAARQARLNFVLKFQQVTGPVVAKGIEDTSFYVYNRLISLNEVGGEPEYFGISTAEFHKQQAERQKRWPGSLLTTSTHDTKRSEDVRARISAISERPRDWRVAVRRWARMNRKHKRKVDGQAAPGANDEYFLYQTLVGVWPFEQEPGGESYQALLNRLVEYMRKALNEAKVHTSWVNPNEEYLSATADFIQAILRRDEANPFLPDFLAFQREIAHYGAFNSLSQLLLKLTSPGAPDIYQGNEIWDLSLVDPDNRRPVDYDLRSRLLAEVEKIADPAAAAALVEAKEDGRIKLLVTSRALCYRRANQALFHGGAYTPLSVQGRHADRIVAFARGTGDRMALTIVPVLVAGLARGERLTPVGSVWADNLLLVPGVEAGQTFRNVFTGEVVVAQERRGTVGLPLEEVLAVFPVALLERSPGESKVPLGLSS